MKELKPWDLWPRFWRSLKRLPEVAETIITQVTDDTFHRPHSMRSNQQSHPPLIICFQKKLLQKKKKSNRAGKKKSKITSYVPFHQVMVANWSFLFLTPHLLSLELHGKMDWNWCFKKQMSRTSTAVKLSPLRLSPWCDSIYCSTLVEAFRAGSRNCVFIFECIC